MSPSPTPQAAHQSDQVLFPTPPAPPVGVVVAEPPTPPIPPPPPVAYEGGEPPELVGLFPPALPYLTRVPVIPVTEPVETVTLPPAELMTYPPPPPQPPE